MYYIGIDIGGTYIKIGIISTDWETIKICKFPTGNNPMEKIIEEIDSICNEFKIKGIGVGIAGLVDKEGNVIKAANIPFLNKFPLKKELENRYNMNVKIENDATAAAVAEALFGQGKGSFSFILLTLGTGIGGGFWFDGEIAQFPLEVGHMSINYQGKFCNCGNTGCLEVYASARAIKDNLIERVENGEESYIKKLYEGNIYRATSEDIYKAAMEGDHLCRSVLKEAGKALGAGIANLINIFGPEKIILTGGLSKAINIYLETAIQEAKKRAMIGIAESVSITQSSLVDKGGVLGAVAILINENLKQFPDRKLKEPKN
ncbi:ROK family protein [Thermodesulfovibrio sp. Kuro-1]|uniref:ROK family protein n=1 Tax=Thermodesulfovibrio sp. Kuro-1 TaxID=2580394 RepID=UPI0011423A06|nr:ROK family protein [Thermodesulfovibrio sp. Kuro-1]